VNAPRRVGVVVLMGALAWASVPLYDWFCRVTGFGGTTSVADRGLSDTILDQTIKHPLRRLLGTGHALGIPPRGAREMDIRIGETGLAFYEAYNPTDRPIAGTASLTWPRSRPAGYFVKIDVLLLRDAGAATGRAGLMPVTFFVDPEIVNDRDAEIPAITLSYTFYVIDLPEDYASLDGATLNDAVRDTPDNN
jgi:cytochrome c oxidase assembly protein subunit 11